MTEPTRNNTIVMIDVYSKLMAMKAIGKRRRKFKERIEQYGSTGGPAPMLTEQREANYRRQNGGGYQLTPRQRRRSRHKSAHAVKAGWLTA